MSERKKELKRRRKRHDEKMKARKREAIAAAGTRKANQA